MKILGKTILLAKVHKTLVINLFIHQTHSEYLLGTKSCAGYQVGSKGEDHSTPALRDLII